MKNDIADILFKYTTGEATLEETNDALKAVSYTHLAHMRQETSDCSTVFIRK